MILSQIFSTSVSDRCLRCDVDPIRVSFRLTIAQNRDYTRFIEKNFQHFVISSKPLVITNQLIYSINFYIYYLWTTWAVKSVEVEAIPTSFHCSYQSDVWNVFICVSNLQLMRSCEVLRSLTETPGMINCIFIQQSVDKRQIDLTISDFFNCH